MLGRCIEIDESYSDWYGSPSDRVERIILFTLINIRNQLTKVELDATC